MPKKVILVEYNDKKEVFGSFREACRVHRLPYWTLVRLDFPIEHKGFKVSKINYKVNKRIS